MTVEIIAAVSALGVAVIGALAAGIVKIVDAVQDRPPTPETQSMKEDIETMKELMDKLDNGFGAMGENVEKIENTIRAMDSAQSQVNLTLLREQIYKVYDDGKQTKSISEKDFEFVNHAYDIYEKIGGNGTAKAYMEDIRTWKRK